MSTHEDFRRDHHVQVGTERSFGLVFTAFFLLVGLFPLIKGGSIRLWALVAAAVFLLVTLVAPRVLAPLNRAWFQLGLLLAKIINPVVLGLFFFVVITPMSLLGRVIGRDALRIRFDPRAKSYWIPRDPPGPAPDSMPQQF